MLTKGYNILRVQTFSRFRYLNQGLKAPIIASVDHQANEQEIRIQNLIDKYKDSILYSGYVENQKLKLGYHKNLAAISKIQKEEEKRHEKERGAEPLPLSLRFLNSDLKKDNAEKINEIIEDKIIQFPFSSDDNVNVSESVKFKDKIAEKDPATAARDVVRSRINLANNAQISNNWMADYENYEENVEIDSNNFTNNYGTPNPNSNISNVPCGGCGALLHCKDTSIPGYIPSEIYKNSNRLGGVDLKSIICQRCYFLRNHNIALQVRVKPSDYPRILKTIRNHEQALVILMVDLLDFPCSIWPGAADLLGYNRPIFVVGNKIDLLPQDGKGFLQRITENLRTNLQLNGFATTDIKHIALISATTGFGVEDFITKLQKFWAVDGDVFLVGCTNVGKSSLFNALLQSDYCKTRAVDLIQKATISQWPGTTLNLLKFPINRPSGYKVHMRYKRLVQESKMLADERFLRGEQLKKTRNPKYASLIGHIGRTFVNKDVVDTQDAFSISGRGLPSPDQIGIDENDDEYAFSKWCYDTPGVVQSEQVLHLLTTEELMLTLPKQLLRPQTFVIKPKTSIFLGGLSRLDFIEGTESTRFTVFCSSSLPVTICHLEDADRIYEEFLTTDLFSVPSSDPERLKQWPGLTASKTFTAKGIDSEMSCADVVLSSSGWIAVTPRRGKEITMRAWAPPNCGTHVREPLLPNAVALRGRRIRDTPAYRTDRFYIP